VIECPPFSELGSRRAAPNLLAHYWARELQAVGHEVRLMPAQYVKAYVKRNKNNAADAEAI
jgi:transposase